jgi:hypothetical protein
MELKQPSDNKYMKNISEAVCIFYTYDNTCILVGVVNENYNIILQKEIYFQKAGIEDIRDFIIDNKEEAIKKIIDNGYGQPPIWTNKNIFLADALSGYLRNQIDFENEHKPDYGAIEDLYSSLVASNRILKLDGVTMQNSYSSHCLKMLLWAIGGETISRDIDNFKMEVGAKRDIYELFDNY